MQSSHPQLTQLTNSIPRVGRARQERKKNLRRGRVGLLRPDRPLLAADPPARTAPARDLNVVILHGHDLGCEGEGAIVGWFPHGKNVKRTLAQVESALFVP